MPTKPAAPRRTWTDFVQQFQADDQEIFRGGRTLQVDVVKSSDGGEIVFEARDVTHRDVNTERPSVGFRRAAADGKETLSCDSVVGADGFHGPSRQAIPAAHHTEYQKIYPLTGLAS